jgi:flagellar L-ring protein precursor FlgH
MDDIPPAALTPQVLPQVPTAPAPKEPPRVATGGIYRAGPGEMLVGRVQRFAAGDVITVLLKESTQAARQATGSVTRAATNDVLPAGVASSLTNLGTIASGVNLNRANVTSKGEGSADQSASLEGSITVTVVEVQPNGNLVVRGEKRMSLTQGSEVIQVSGVIRPEDVAPNNTVQSRRLANANFVYQGGGEIASASRAGWGTRSLLKFWPF